MNTFQGKKMLAIMQAQGIQLERIAEALEKLEARSDHFLVALARGS